MKIFYTKKDRELIENYERIIGLQEETIFKLRKDIKKFENLYNALLEENEQNRTKINGLKFKLRKYYGRNGGLTKYNNRLKRMIEELKGNDHE